jgi:4-diphosphocytidyl-2-C-methyl-D-erythritol kinase
MKPTVARVVDDTTLLCPAKLNAVLSVGEPGDDGYHPVESVMLSLISFDEKTETLSLCRNSSKSSGIKLSIFGNEALSCSTYDHNLVVKAYNAFYQKFSLEPLPLKVSLNKIWPTQGGLGGGSSNAAAMLRYLAGAHTIPLLDNTLHGVAASLGADVAFFLQAQPALASGRGEVLTLIAIHLALPTVQWLLVKPHSLGISTPWAYQALDEQRSLGRLSQPSLMLNQRSLALKTFLEQPPEVSPYWHAAFSEHLHNDFQSLAWQAFDDYRVIEKKLQTVGCLTTLLCGSGATVAGLLPPGLEWSKKEQADLELLFTPNDYWTHRAMTPWT